MQKPDYPTGSTDDTGVGAESVTRENQGRNVAMLPGKFLYPWKFVECFFLDEAGQMKPWQCENLPD